MRIYPSQQNEYSKLKRKEISDRLNTGSEDLTIEEIYSIIEKPKFIEKFKIRMEKLISRGSENECWPWLGTKLRGYGVTTIRDVQFPTHRLSYLMHHGVIKKNLFVCHKCDNPICVNPHHLFLGTPKDNTQDASKKGRMTKGQKHWCSKLTDEQVIEVRERYKRGGIMQIELAKEYGMSQPGMNHLLLGKTRPI